MKSLRSSHQQLFFVLKHCRHSKKTGIVLDSSEDGARTVATKPIRDKHQYEPLFERIKVNVQTHVIDSIQNMKTISITKLSSIQNIPMNGKLAIVM